MATKYDTSYYDKALKDYENQAKKTANQQIADTNAQYDAQLKQAYTNNMIAQRNLKNQMTSAGIRGGATETANLNLANQYANSRGSINASRNADIKNINNTMNDNIYNYTQSINDNKQQYLQQREAEARQRQYAVADAKQQRAWAVADANKQDSAARWQTYAEAKYGMYSSRTSLKKQISALAKKYAKAKGNTRKMYEKQLNAARQRYQYLTDLARKK